MFRACILIAGILLPFAAGGCPKRCNCTENSVTCISMNLQMVPSFEKLTNNPMIIDLSGNSISIIDPDHFGFDKSEQVREIYLNESQVTLIEEKTFDELESLQELYLSNNYLSSLPESLISKNENMILLDISSNYFTEFPKIASESLEVLAIANSQVASIQNDALDKLPNLRMLLLQQNNLKHVDVAVFQNNPTLFFVRVAFNPWQCSCKTVKLFNFLTEKGLIDITEPIQCHTIDKIFIDIYDQSGVTDAFQNQCQGNLNADTEIKVKSLLENREEDKHEEIGEVSLREKEIDVEETEEIYSFLYCLVIFAIVVLSFIVGAILGSYFTYRHFISTLRQSESQKELLRTIAEDIS